MLNRIEYLQVESEYVDSLLNYSGNYVAGTVMEGVKPRYTYKLTEGITADRHGMMIIEHEGILELIKGPG